MIINFLSAFALVFVFEGIMPFVFPNYWKKLLHKIISQDEIILRLFGFFSMLMGVILLTVVHQFMD